MDIVSPCSSERNPIEHVSLDCTCEGQICSKCDVLVCIGALHHDKRWVNPATYCRKCHLSQKKVWRDAHPEKEVTYRSRRKTKPYWNEQNPVRVKAYIKRHPERLKARWRANRIAHPEYSVVSHANRRIRESQTGEKFTAQQWSELKAYYNYTCLCCGRKEPEIKLHADHVIPLACGGTNDIGNIQPLCKSCNSRKHTQTIDYRPNH